MKNIFYVIALFTLIYSCKKDKYHFSTSDITETDVNGNEIGNINSTNWTINLFSEADDFDKSVLAKYESDYQRLSDPTFSFSKFKNNCTKPSLFKLIAYPNPMHSDCWLNFKLNSNFSYLNAIEIIAKKNGEIIQTSGFSNATNWKSKINALVVRDFIYYGIFITSDSCIFYTKGNVIGCTN